ncbi:hypothetical protein BJ165DRAFT_1409852 [Panaeolus papilionaceus]|nr:hypothetical protein BJ165DRAFT_1409852 [Panaeolus papilionaceus]
MALKCGVVDFLPIRGNAIEPTLVKERGEGCEDPILSHLENRLSEFRIEQSIAVIQSLDCIVNVPITVRLNTPPAPIFFHRFSSETMIYTTRGVQRMASNKWGYGWGAGKKDKEREYEEEAQMNEKAASQTDLPLYQSSHPSVRRNTQSSQARKSTVKTQGHTLTSQDSTPTLVGSIPNRKMEESDTVRPKVDTTARIGELRHLMPKDKLDYCVIPSEDAHSSEFTGSASQAVVSRNSAYLLTDSRYWIPSPAGGRQQPDPRSGRQTLDSKLIYPLQNHIDLVWKDKPPKSTDKVYVHGLAFTGVGADVKLAKVWEGVDQGLPFLRIPSQNLLLFRSMLPTFSTSEDPIFPTTPYCMPTSSSGTLVKDCLNDLGVEQRAYMDLWPVSRTRTSIPPTASPHLHHRNTPLHEMMSKGGQAWLASVRVVSNGEAVRGMRGDSRTRGEIALSFSRDFVGLEKGVSRFSWSEWTTDEHGGETQTQPVPKKSLSASRLSRKSVAARLGVSMSSAASSDFTVDIDVPDYTLESDEED